MRLVLLVVMVLLLVGARSTWPHGIGLGYLPAGELGLPLLILIIIFTLAGRRFRRSAIDAKRTPICALTAA